MKKILLLCLITFSAYAKILEIEHFEDIAAHLTEETLLILDIDDTLIVPAQMLGSDRWFLSRVQGLQKEGHSPASALERTIAEWIAIRHITQMKIVEKGSDQLVREWQERKIPIIALTTQGLATATNTREQLKANGFDLSKSSPFPSNHYLDNKHSAHLTHHGIFYRDGIVFASGYEKGKTLAMICKHSGYWPKRIVFVDDKKSYLLEIEKFAHEHGIEYTGLRFVYADKHKAEYSDEIAEIQLTHSTFKRLMSDEEALAIIGASLPNR